MLRSLLTLLSCTALVQVASADTLRLANGDTIQGEVVDWAVDHVVLEHPQLGRIRLSLEQLDIDTGEPPTPGLFGTRWLRGWSRHVDAGWSGRVGDGRSINIRANLALAYADPFKRWDLAGRYLYQDAGDDQDNDARVDLRRDWLLPESDWFGFLGARYQFDEFEVWKHRNVLSGGPGYTVVDGPRHELMARAGPTYTREWEGDGRDTFETLVGVEYRWHIDERTLLSLSHDLYLAIAPGAGDVRNLSVGELRIRLLERPALSLQLGAENEHVSNPEPGSRTDVLSYYLSFGLDF